MLRITAAAAARHRAATAQTSTAIPAAMAAFLALNPPDGWPASWR